MRAKLTALLLVPVLLGVLAPSPASARRILLLGSLRIQEVPPAGPIGPVTPGDVTGLVVIMNPGIEKTMAQQVPPYMVPVFVDTDNGGPNLDTLVALTNTLPVPITLRVTFHNQVGAEIGARTLTLPALGTESFLVSALVP